MADGPSLIKQRLASGLRVRLPPIDAHCAYVLAYRTGELRAFGYTPRIGDRAGSVWCYIVDTSPRASNGTLRIPARGDRYSFNATYDAQWRVIDPHQVVRGNVVHGEPTVSGFLTSRLRPVGRQFDPDDAWGVETHVNTTLGAEAETRWVPVGNGLAVVALTVQVTPDARVADRGVAIDDDTHQGALTERRTIRLRRLLDGDGAAIHYHLAQNPDDTHAVLQMIMEARDKNERLRLEWLDRMRADDAIQEADYEHARAAVLGGGTTPPPALHSGSFETWPNARPPVIESGPPTPPPAGPARGTVDPADPFPVPASAPASDPPPAPDPNPFAAPTGHPAWLLDKEGETTPPAWPPAQPPPTVHVPEPTPPGAPESSTPRPPRDVRAERLANGSVLVRWSGVGDVEYRVRCQVDDDQWRVTARTKDTWIEDGEAPDGAVPVYAVSAVAGGARSAEVRSAS